jgi:raffinose/stachyose/melibiose transport system permease protein/N-acetylglucosamine transport system permease protein
MRKMPKRVKADSLLYKRTGGQKAVFSAALAVFALYALSMLLPLFLMLMTSLENKIMYQINLSKPFSLPTKLVFENYRFAFSELSYKDTSIFGMFFNSAWYTVAAVAGNIFMCTCTAYALSRYKFKASKLYYAVILFSMTVPTIGTTAAQFRLANFLGLYNTPFYILFTSMSGIGMPFLMLYGFFKNISQSYAEAAFMDGAGHFTVFFRIMIPMALPAMGALAVIGGIGAWNNYETVLLYMPDYPTLASGLYGLSQTLPRLGNTPAYYAALIIALVPVLIVFSFFSDKIMRNFSVGGLKG